jgi:hypothetical protein
MKKWTKSGALFPMAHQLKSSRSTSRPRPSERYAKPAE